MPTPVSLTSTALSLFRQRAHNRSSSINRQQLSAGTLPAERSSSLLRLRLKKFTQDGETLVFRFYFFEIVNLFDPGTVFATQRLHRQ